MFWISSCLLRVRAGNRGPVQSNHCEGTGRRVRLSGTRLCLKRLVSSQIIGGAGAEWRVRRRFWGYMRHSLCVDDGTIGPVRCVLAARSWVLLGALRNPHHTYCSTTFFLLSFDLEFHLVTILQNWFVWIFGKTERKVAESTSYPAV